MKLGECGARYCQRDCHTCLQNRLRNKITANLSCHRNNYQQYGEKVRPQCCSHLSQSTPWTCSTQDAYKQHKFSRDLQLAKSSFNESSTKESPQQPLNNINQDRQQSTQPHGQQPSSTTSNKPYQEPDTSRWTALPSNQDVIPDDLKAMLQDTLSQPLPEPAGKQLGRYRIKHQLELKYKALQQGDPYDSDDQVVVQSVQQDESEDDNVDTMRPKQKFDVLKCLNNTPSVFKLATVTLAAKQDFSILNYEIVLFIFQKLDKLLSNRKVDFSVFDPSPQQQFLSLLHDDITLLITQSQKDFRVAFPMFKLFTILIKWPELHNLPSLTNHLQQTLLLTTSNLKPYQLIDAIVLATKLPNPNPDIIHDMLLTFLRTDQEHGRKCTAEEVVRILRLAVSAKTKCGDTAVPPQLSSLATGFTSRSNGKKGFNIVDLLVHSHQAGLVPNGPDVRELYGILPRFSRQMPSGDAIRTMQAIASFSVVPPTSLKVSLLEAVVKNGGRYPPALVDVAHAVSQMLSDREGAVRVVQQNGAHSKEEHFKGRLVQAMVPVMQRLADNPDTLSQEQIVTATSAAAAVALDSPMSVPRSMGPAVDAMAAAYATSATREKAEQCVVLLQNLLVCRSFEESTWTELLRIVTDADCAMTGQLIQNIATAISGYSDAQHAPGRVTWFLTSCLRNYAALPPSACTPGMTSQLLFSVAKARFFSPELLTSVLTQHGPALYADPSPANVTRVSHVLLQFGYVTPELTQFIRSYVTNASAYTLNETSLVVWAAALVPGTFQHEHWAATSAHIATIPLTESDSPALIRLARTSALLHHMRTHTAADVDSPEPPPLLAPTPSLIASTLWRKSKDQAYLGGWRETLLTHVLTMCPAAQPWVPGSFCVGGTLRLRTGILLNPAKNAGHVAPTPHSDSAREPTQGTDPAASHTPHEHHARDASPIKIALELHSYQNVSSNDVHKTLMGVGYRRQVLQHGGWRVLDIGEWEWMGCGGDVAAQGELLKGKLAEAGVVADVGLLEALKEGGAEKEDEEDEVDWGVE